LRLIVTVKCTSFAINRPVKSLTLVPNTPMFNFYAEGMHAALSNPLAKASLGQFPRYCHDGTMINLDMLKSLEDGRHLHNSVIPILSKLIELDISMNPLTVAMPSSFRPNRSVAAIDWCDMMEQKVVKGFHDVSGATSSISKLILDAIMTTG
jgi:hypothetical protein